MSNDRAHSGVSPLFPGATLGILGGGQLGRYFTLAARQMGYRVVVLDPDPASPAGRMADEHVCAAYDDTAALERLATCDAVTTEFENVPAATLTALAARTRVAPSATAVSIAQDRAVEKNWLAAHAFATAPFAVVRDASDLEAACAATGLPAILKVARFGYDGKGQARVASVEDARAAFAEFGEQACVLEGLVRFDSEISVVLARGFDGATAAFPPAENRHVDSILDLSIVPAGLPDAVQNEALAEACRLAAALDYVGVMAVEFFVVGDTLAVNEIAPRPHNSGHYTLDACATSQFEQQVRALAGLPLGDARLLSPVTMKNLLGDDWPPDWATLLADPGAKLHLYGKTAARPGRKMGHVNVLGK
jgi:5-(carboxyamino)imidazole ribonucleotide synthase